MLASKPATALLSRIEWWSRVIARQQSSQVTLDQFCRQMGISTRMFYYWKKRVQEAREVSCTRHVTAPQSSVRTAAPAQGGAASFVPVSIVTPAAAGELEIELANGCAVRLRGTVDPGLLQVAIEAVAQLDGSGRGGR